MSENPEAQAPPTDPVKDRIVAKLIEKQGGNPICPVCKFDKFAIGEFVSLQALNNPNEGRIGGGGAYPMVSLFCQRCGAAQFLNLLILGFALEDLPALTVNVPRPPPHAEAKKGNA